MLSFIASYTTPSKHGTQGNVVSILGHRQRRWPNIETALKQHWLRVSWDAHVIVKQEQLANSFLLIKHPGAPVSTIRWANAGLMLTQPCKRCSKIRPTLDQRLVFTVRGSDHTTWIRNPTAIILVFMPVINGILPLYEMTDRLFLLMCGIECKKRRYICPILLFCMWNEIIGDVSECSTNTLWLSLSGG